MRPDSHRTFELSAAYIVTTLLAISAITLSALIIKLLNTTFNIKKNEDEKSAAIPFLVITMIAVASFLLSILLIIGIIIQLLLIDGYQLEKHIYYQLFEMMQCGTTIFDSIGHLLMIWLFISRLKLCFENSIFEYPQRLMRIIHITLSILSLSAMIIMVEIARDDHNVYVVITVQTIWKVAIECMCLWLLYLFCDKLYALIQLSLAATARSAMHTKNARSDVEILSEVVAEMSPKLQHYSSSDESENKMRKHHSDGTDLQSVTAYTMNSDQHTSDDHKLAPSSRKSNTEEQIMEFVNLMNKVTLLVVISVCASLLSLIGNVFIEMHEVQTIEQHTVSMRSMWTFLLPAVDAIITSFMLFLQFPSSANIYDKMCYKLDVLFLTLCLRIHGAKNKDKESIVIEKVTVTEPTAPSSNNIMLPRASDAKSLHIQVPTMSPQHSHHAITISFSAII